MVSQPKESLREVLHIGVLISPLVFPATSGSPWSSTGHSGKSLGSG